MFVDKDSDESALKAQKREDRDEAWTKSLDKFADLSETLNIVRNRLSQLMATYDAKRKEANQLAEIDDKKRQDILFLQHFASINANEQAPALLRPNYQHTLETLEKTKNCILGAIFAIHTEISTNYSTHISGIFPLFGARPEGGWLNGGSILYKSINECFFSRPEIKNAYEDPSSRLLALKAISTYIEENQALLTGLDEAYKANLSTQIHNQIENIQRQQTITQVSLN